MTQMIISCVAKVTSPARIGLWQLVGAPPLPGPFQASPSGSSVVVTMTSQPSETLLSVLQLQLALNYPTLVHLHRLLKGRTKPIRVKYPESP